MTKLHTPHPTPRPLRGCCLNSGLIIISTLFIIMVLISTIGALVLGVFELWQFVSIEVLHDFSGLDQVKLFPHSFQTNRYEYLLLCTFFIFLGLLRVNYAVSGRTVASWLIIILAHVVTSWFLWSLALLPHFNVHNLSFTHLAQDITTGRYDIPSSVLLFLVPGFALFFLLCGPGISRGGDHKKKTQ